MYRSQNLNDGKRPRFGGKVRHGRAWWGKLSWEWSLFWGKPCHLTFSRMSFSLAIVFFSLHFRIGDRDEDGKQFCLTIHDGTIWLNLGHDQMSSSSRDPFIARTHSFSPLDFLFGRMRYECEIRESFDVQIPMPEANYPAKVTFETRTWWRPRWPHWPLKIVRDDCDTQIPGGIPFEGKGENSWDCGEDGVYGSGSTGHDIPDAISSVVKTVLEYRARYGTPPRIRQMIEAGR